MFASVFIISELDQNIVKPPLFDFLDPEKGYMKAFNSQIMSKNI
jgi:hypothetical protein